MTQPGDVIGFVDGADRGEIFGWAMDQGSPDDCVLLYVCVSGRPVMTIGTFEYRPDVAVAFGNRGMNGFRLQLPTEALNGHFVDVSILSQTGDHLNNSPLQLSGPPRPQSGRPCVLFMHIPRTSGTAFREAIQPNYAGSERLFYYPDPPGVWYERFEVLPAPQRATFRFVTGHFVFGLHSFIDAPCEYVTIVRDPVARVVSNYWLAVRNKPADISPDGRLLTLENVLERQILRELDNLTVRCFGGYGERECPGMIGPEAYEAAVENVHRFRFIGHQDRTPEAWNCLRGIYGWQHGELKHVNAGRPEEHSISKRTRAAIEHYCRYDLAFYKNVLLPRL